MPELEFKEDEPLKTVIVTPTMARQAQIELAATGPELTESSEPRVRFSEWRQVPGEQYAGFNARFPTWLFVAVSAGILLAIAELWLPQNLVPIQIHVGNGRHIFPPFVIGGLVMIGLFFAGPLVVAVQASAYHLRFRNRVNDEIKSRSSRGRVTRTEFGDLHGDLVGSIMFAQRGIVYGEDAGVLTFDGNSLFFEGTQTSFSIAKKRLTLKPQNRGRPRLTYSGLPAYLLRLTYEEGGLEYELGFFQWTVIFGDGPSPTMTAFKTWLSAPSSPVVAEVLPPRDAPKSALSAARRTMLMPILVAEVLCFFFAIFLRLVLLSRAHPSSIWSSEPAFARIGEILMIVLAFEFLTVGYMLSFRPLKQAIRRYRFVKDRS